MNKKKFLTQTLSKLCILFAVITALYLYQSYHGGDSGSAAYKFKNFFSTGTVFEFQPTAILDKTIKETGKITYSSGKILSFENNYKAREKRTFSDSFLTLDGKIEGDLDPALKPLIKNDTYLQKFDLSSSYCPEDFVPHYPSALRRYIYFISKTPLFDGKVWETLSCNGKFACSYSVSMKKEENRIDFGCSGNIGESSTTISAGVVINSDFDGFSQIKMEIISENKDLISEWVFQEGNSATSSFSQ